MGEWEWDPEPGDQQARTSTVYCVRYISATVPVMLVLSTLGYVSTSLCVCANEPIYYYLVACATTRVAEPPRVTAIYDFSAASTVVVFAGLHSFLVHP